MRSDVRMLLAIFVGGFIGTVARAAVSELLPASGAEWPWATFVVNVAGAFALGCLVTRRRAPDASRSYGRALVGTGFCGALTTFSTLQLELLQMLDDGRFTVAGVYAGASVAAGLGAVVVAARLARRPGVAA